MVYGYGGHGDRICGGGVYGLVSDNNSMFGYEFSLNISIDILIHETHGYRL
jgi:hypothetical protein